MLCSTSRRCVRTAIFSAWMAIVVAWAAQYATGLYRLSTHYQQQADAAEVEEYFAAIVLHDSLDRAERLRSTMTGPGLIETEDRCTLAAVMAANEFVIAQQAERACRWKHLRDKYTRAAAVPWQRIEPDPPEPDGIELPGMRSPSSDLIAKSL